MKNRLSKIFFLVATLIIIGCKESLIHNLSENEAHKVITKLQRNQITAEKELQTDGKWSVLVANEDFVKAIESLETLRILKREKPAHDQENSIFMSRDQQQFKLEKMISNSVEETLLSLRGILEAKVHITKPYKLSVLDQVSEGKESGSVILVVNDEFQLQQNQIKSLVSGATGLSKEAIEVVISKELESERQDNTGREANTNIINAPTLLRRLRFRDLVYTLSILVLIVLFVAVIRNKIKVIRFKRT